MTTQMERRSAERDPLLNFLPVDDIFQVEAVTVAADGDMMAVRPGEGAGAGQQAATVQWTDVQATVVFAHSVGRYSGHINRSHFSVYFWMRR